jgi:hypothetical protein
MSRLLVVRCGQIGVKFSVARAGYQEHEA